MTTKLEAVLALEWRAQIVPVGQGLVAGQIVIVYDNGKVVYNVLPEHAIIAVLGKRAVEMMLQLEKEYVLECPRCNGERIEEGIRRGHEPHCEWGRIVAAAKELDT